MVLLQELEEQKAKLEQMLLEAQQEREDLKAVVTQDEPVNPPEVPVHEQDVTPVTPGIATEVGFSIFLVIASILQDTCGQCGIIAASALYSWCLLQVKMTTPEGSKSTNSGCWNKTSVFFKTCNEANVFFRGSKYKL